MVPRPAASLFFANSALEFRFSTGAGHPMSGMAMGRHERLGWRGTLPGRACPAPRSRDASHGRASDRRGFRTAIASGAVLRPATRSEWAVPALPGWRLPWLAAPVGEAKTRRPAGPVRDRLDFLEAWPYRY